MNVKARISSICLVLALFALETPLFGQSNQKGLAPNPGIFRNFAAPVSSIPAFLASEAGKQVLLHSPNPAARQLLQRFFGSSAASQWPVHPLLQGPSGTALVESPTVTGCGTASGTQFNLEPALNALPQNEPPVDFIPNGIAGPTSFDLVVQSANDFRGLFGATGLTGVYVHRDGTVACYGGTDFEMFSPPIPNPLHPGSVLLGDGDPRVTADHTRSQFILTDLRFPGLSAGVGLRRIPSANLTNTTTCPAGTQTPAKAAICAGSSAVVLGASDEDLPDFDNSTQDPRLSGTGAGDIYVTWTRFDFDFSFTTEIDLSVCKATFSSLADCSSPVIASGPDTIVSLSGVAVVPGGTNAGKITVSYVNINTSTGATEIKMAVCTPKGAPLAPTCAPPALVKTEPNHIISFSIGGDVFFGGLTDNTFRIFTVPVIADRADAGGGQTTFIVWDNCKVLPSSALFNSPCPDADIVMATSTNLGGTWSAVSPVDNATGTHEFFPAISVDPGQNITNIAYYKTTDAFHYKNRTQVELKQIPSGSTVPGSATVVTSAADSPAGDPNIPFFFPAYGDYIGVSARSTGTTAGTGRAFIGHTNDSRLGSYSGALNPESNNHVSRLTY